MAITEIPGLDSLLGGYDAFGLFADADSTKVPLFTTTELEELTFDGETAGKQYTYLKPAWVRHARRSSSDEWQSTQETEHGYRVSISARTKVNAKSMAFAGEVNASFSEEQRMAPSQAYSGFEDVIVNWTLTLPDEDAQALRARLTPEARKDIDGAMLPVALFERYGTHYVKTVWMGGKAARYSSTNTTSYSGTVSIEVAAKMSFKKVTKGLSADEEATYGKSIESFDKTSQTKERSRGGSTAFESNIFSGGLVAWSATVEDNPVLVEFPQKDALEPLWALAATEARRAEIEKAFNDYVTSMTCVMYDDEIYLQVGTTTAGYMYGAWGDGNELVRMKTKADIDREYFRWRFCRETSQVGEGPVEYGDVVSLRSEVRRDRWLSGVRGGENEGVYTKDPTAEPTLAATYRWRIQKSFDEVGSGPIPYEEAKDGKIHLRCEYIKLDVVRWLRSGDDDSIYVYTKDPESDVHPDTYSWIVKRKID